MRLTREGLLQAAEQSRKGAAFALFEQLSLHRNATASAYEFIAGLQQLADYESMAEKTSRALEIARNHGGIEGSHHKAWVIDQMVRTLTAERYPDFVIDAKAGEDGPETYDWDEGIAP